MKLEEAVNLVAHVDLDTTVHHFGKEIDWMVYDCIFLDILIGLQSFNLKRMFEGNKFNSQGWVITVHAEAITQYSD